VKPVIIIAIAIGLILLGALYVTLMPQKEIWKFEPKPEDTTACRGLNCPYLEKTEECGLGMWVKENGEYASLLDAKKMNEGLVIQDFSNCLIFPDS